MLMSCDFLTHYYMNSPSCVSDSQYKDVNPNLFSYEVPVNS